MRHPRSLAEQRDWMLRRLEVKPVLTSRALVAELHARAIPASYGSVWRLLDDEGIRFKKSLHASEQDRPDVARRRALEAPSRQARPLSPGLHRRDLGQAQHDAHPWPLHTRQAPRRQGAARTLEDVGLPSRLAVGLHPGALCDRRPHQWPILPGLCRADTYKNESNGSLRRSTRKDALPPFKLSPVNAVARFPSAAAMADRPPARPADHSAAACSQIHKPPGPALCRQSRP